ncbi:MFS transporter [Pasteurella canis]|uniref:MFS transporter n=1 Tax=Pasteurella canis TaxID=753 RepID=UPI001322C7DC|nr:MFS transporter [Pasteurella canis]MXN89322.1 MFS transporter [Pasteurella canis]
MRNNPRQVAIATMVGTAIEYFDNYIYAMAAVLVFNHQFFHSADPVSNELASLSTLALAFFARPFGAMLFGHFGDKIGRKKSLIASLLLMGIATVTIGLLPNYAQIGIWATVLLCLCRIGQGIGLGGEWGGAALVAIENAPPEKRAWYGIFPQLGAPVGLLLANGAFFTVGKVFGQEALIEWAWRIPFIASAILVVIGWYVRTKIHESAVFVEAEKQGKTHTFPIKAVFTQHLKPFITSVFLATAGYVLFYILAAFAQIYAKSPTTLSSAGHPMGLGMQASTFTAFLLITSVIFGISIAFSGIYADKIGRRRLMQYVSIATLIFGLALPLFLSEATPTNMFAFLTIGFIIMGMSFGPMAVLLPELFPTEVRYSGASIAYNLAGILGASVATIVAIKINAHFGLIGVGIYLAANALISFIATTQINETKQCDLKQI